MSGMGPVLCTDHTPATFDPTDALRAVYLQSFPPNERKDFDELLAACPRLARADVDGSPAALAVIEELPVIGAALLSYLATDERTRNAGVGSALLRFLLADAPARYPGGLLLEVEPPEAGRAADAALRARRLGFYRRHGAVVLPVRYQMPSFTGGDPLPMLLLAIGGPPARPAVWLAGVLGALYADIYDLDADDPLAVAATSSLAT